MPQGSDDEIKRRGGSLKEDIMAQITIEVPDALAKRLVSVQDRLPEVIARWLDSSPPLSNEVYRYVLAFLAKNPSLQEILDFRLTPAMQERSSDLLEKNRSEALTSMESAELDEYVYINDLVSLLKARALRHLRTHS
jgi:hypothetical protein